MNHIVGHENSLLINSRSNCRAALVAIFVEQTHSYSILFENIPFRLQTSPDNVEIITLKINIFEQKR